MAYNQVKYASEYNKKHYERVELRVSLGKKEEITAFAKTCGLSTNEFINQAINEKMEREKEKKNMSNRLFVCDKEAGNIIAEVGSIEEGKALIAEYEANDKKEDTYTDNFYDVVNEDRISVL